MNIIMAFMLGSSMLMNVLMIIGHASITEKKDDEIRKLKTELMKITGELP